MTFSSHPVGFISTEWSGVQTFHLQRQVLKKTTHQNIVLSYSVQKY